MAVREVVMAKGNGRADYLLYVGKKAVGVNEAKPQGTTLSGVEWQSAMYAEGLPPDVRLKAVTTDGRLPFVFEASASETHFTNGYDPHPGAHARHRYAKGREPDRGQGLADRGPGHPAYGRALEPAVWAQVFSDHGRCGRARGSRGPRD